MGKDIKKILIPNQVPPATSFKVDQIVINPIDGKAFIKKTDNTVIELGSGSGTVVSGTTNTGTVISGVTDIRLGLDIVNVVVADGDRVNFSDFDNLGISRGTVLSGTTLHDGSANTAKVVSGLFDPAAGTFSTGAYDATNNDTLLQVSGGETATTINNFLLLDSGVVSRIAFVAKIGLIS